MPTPHIASHTLLIALALILVSAAALPLAAAEGEIPDAGAALAASPLDALGQADAPETSAPGAKSSLHAFGKADAPETWSPSATSPLDALGQADVPEPPPADELVLFAPRLGGDLHERRCQCFSGTDGVQCTCESPDSGTRSLAPYSGFAVQNAGDRDGRYIAAYFDSPEPGTPDACDECTIVGWSCSPSVSPGRRYTFPPFWSGPDPTQPVTPTFAAAAVAYSLNTREAREYGPQWQDWLVESGLPADTTLAEIACRVMADELDGPQYSGNAPRSAAANEACDAYSAFHLAFTTDAEGTLPGTSLPVAPLRGEPSSGTVSVLDTGTSGTSPTLDRYVAMALPEVGRPVDLEPAGHSYLVPGGYGAMQDGTSSALMVQNAGTGCADVTVQAHRSRFGPFAEPLHLRLPPGARQTVSVGDSWPGLANTMVTLAVSGDQPLASTLVNLNYATSATHGAFRERQSTVRWLVPRAYQEERQISHEVSVAHRISAYTAQVVSADGWETNLAVYNPHADTRDVFMRMQATGEPPRGPISYPIEGMAQRVLQPGFGLGLPGGPGWMEMTSSETPMYVSVESLRQANNSALTVAAWSVGAWSHDDGSEPPVAIALPDLGGPALGPSHMPAGTITTSLAARVAVQNPATMTARIAIDTYHDACGYVGTIERSIDPRQTLVVPVAELAGAAQGANSAILRVLAGEVGAVLEAITHDRQAASSDAPPIDVSNAYRGGRLSTAPPLPEAVTATLTASPLVIEMERPVTVTHRSVTIGASPAANRCVTYGAQSDAAWLTASPVAGMAPGTLTLSIDPALLGPGATQVGVVTVTADQPWVEGSPLEIHVTVTGGQETALYVPLAWAPERFVR